MKSIDSHGFCYFYASTIPFWLSRFNNPRSIEKNKLNSCGLTPHLTVECVGNSAYFPYAFFPLADIEQESVATGRKTSPCSRGKSKKQMGNFILVGGWATPLKNMRESIGMIRIPIYGKIKLMFQTTNQLYLDLLLNLEAMGSI